MLKCYSFWGCKAGPEHWLIFADFALQVHSAMLAKSVVKQYKIENSLNYWNRKEGLQIWRIVERINIFCSNETQEVWMFIFKTAWKSYCKNNEKIPGNLQKNWKNHGNIMEFCQSGKVGTLETLDIMCYFVSCVTSELSVQLQLYDQLHKSRSFIIWWLKVKVKDAGGSEPNKVRTTPLQSKFGFKITCEIFQFWCMTSKKSGMLFKICQYVHHKVILTACLILWWLE